MVFKVMVMSKVYGIVLGILMVVVMIDTVVSWSDRWRADNRMDAMVKEGDAVVERMRMMDLEGRLRDSMMMEKVKGSMERIEDLTRLKDMTRLEIKRLEDSIRSEKVVLDSLKKGMLVW